MASFTITDFLLPLAPTATKREFVSRSNVLSSPSQRSSWMAISKASDDFQQNIAPLIPHLTTPPDKSFHSANALRHPSLGMPVALLLWHSRWRRARSQSHHLAPYERWLMWRDALEKTDPAKCTQALPLTLLLASRVVELTKARHPILVLLFSLKPLFFKGLKIELRALGHFAA